MIKRILSLMLTLSLVLSSGVGYAFAADSAYSVQTPAALEAALNNPDVTEIVLANDLTVAGTIDIDPGRDIVIDGAGYTIKADALGRLMRIAAGDDEIVLRNLVLDNDDAASGLEVYRSSNVKLFDVTVVKSAGYGLEILGSSVAAANLHVNGSVDGSVRIESNGGGWSGPPRRASALAVDGVVELFDARQVYCDDYTSGSGWSTTINATVDIDGFDILNLGSDRREWRDSRTVEVVFYKADGAEIEDTYSNTVRYGGDAVAPADPVKTGHTFVGWDNELTDLVVNTEFRPEFEINSYQVVFKDFTGDLTQKELDFESPVIDIPVPHEKLHYSFEGWKVQGTADTETVDFGTYTMPAGDVVFEAVYAVNLYKVDFMDREGLEAIKSVEITYNVSVNQAVANGNVVLLTADDDETEVEGYTFVGWNYDLDAPITGDTKIDPEYDINEYDIDFYGEDGSWLGRKLVEYNTDPADAGIVAPDAPEGFEFVGWAKRVAGQAGALVEKITEEIDLIATYVIKTFKVVFLGADDEVLDEQIVEYGKDAVAPAADKEGYTFLGWTGDFLNITADTTVTADYAINSYDVVFLGFEGVELGSAVAEYNSSVVAPEAPFVPGYTFAGWSVDGEEIDLDEFVVTGDVEIQAVYFAAASISLEGADRYATAAKIALAGYPNGADTVVIATGTNWADALGGSALAGALDAPIILVGQNEIDLGTQQALNSLDPSKVIILGGEGVISAGISNTLVGMGYTVERIGGADRYATADKIAARVIAELGDDWDGTAMFATGANFADGLAASPLAAGKQWPIFLVNPAAGDLSNGAKAVLADLDKAIILGGTGAVPAFADTKLAGVDTLVRLSGSDRYATAAAVAEYAVEKAGMKWNGVALATGLVPFDALGGGVLQGLKGSVMLLTDPNVLSAPAADMLEANADDIVSVTYFGGTGAVSAAVRAAVDAKLGR